MAGFFGMFDYTKPGKGVSKEDLDKSGIALYFDILARRFWKLILLNIIYVVFSIPAFLISWFACGFLIAMLTSALSMSLEAMEFQLLTLFSCTMVVLLCGSGSASAAMSYVLRKYVNDTHSWVWSDFWEHFRSNFVQGTLAFIVNIVVFVLCCISVIFYTILMRGTISVVLTTAVALVFFVFALMQLYVYQIMASFKLKLKDIYRNALLLTLGRLPVNIIAAAVTVGFIYLYNLVVANALSMLVLIFIFYTLVVFTQIFMTNNTVKKYLLVPSEKAMESSQLQDDAEKNDTEEAL